MIWAAQKSGFAKYSIFGWSKQSGLYQRGPAQPRGISLATWSPPTYSPGPAGPQPRQSLAPCTWPVKAKRPRWVERMDAGGSHLYRLRRSMIRGGSRKWFFLGRGGNRQLPCNQIEGRGEKDWWVWGWCHSNPPEAGETQLPGIREARVKFFREAIWGYRALLGENCLSRVRGGCGSAFFPSPRQASSWRWRQLPPHDGASPPWPAGRPAAGTPGLHFPGSATGSPTRKRVSYVIFARRKLRPGFRLRGWYRPPPRAQRPRLLRREGAAKLRPGVPTHVYSSDPLNFLWPSSTATPASRWRSATAHWLSTECHTLSWIPRIPYQAYSNPFYANRVYLLESLRASDCGMPYG